MEDAANSAAASPFAILMDMRTVLAPTCLSLLVMVTALACSSTDKPKTSDYVPNINGGGGSGSDGGLLADAASDASDGGECLPGTFDLDVTSNQGGPISIAGSVDLAQVVAIGKRFELAVGSQNSGAAEAFTLIATAPLGKVAYRVRGLLAGSYVVRAQGDLGGTEVVGETGDLDGYYNGSAAGPILLRADATAGQLDDDCVGSVNFGIGSRP